MIKNEHSIKAEAAAHVEHEAQPLEEAQANKKRFVEPEISVPVDVFNATTFFLFASTEVEAEF